jgi:hypothetical protein
MYPIQNGANIASFTKVFTATMLESLVTFLQNSAKFGLLIKILEIKWNDKA